MIDKNKSEEFISKVYKIVDALDEWEISDSLKIKNRAIVAVNGRSAISFCKEREMMRAVFFIHPDINFDRKQKVVRNVIRLLPGESIETCVRKMQKDFLPRVIEQTKRLKTIDE